MNEEKKKRPPNRWQLYLSSCLKEQPKGSGLGEKVSSCSIQYRDLKTNNPKKLDDIISTVKSKKEIKKVNH